MSFLLTKSDVRKIMQEELEPVLLRLENINAKARQIMATQAETTEELRAMKAQVAKIAKEQSDRFDMLTMKIADLERIIREGEVTPELGSALADVRTALNDLDATIPDAPPA